MVGFVFNKVGFSEVPGVVPDMRGKEPLDFFHLSDHPTARAHDWIRAPMSLKEVDALLAMVIGMGIVGLPTLR